MLDYIESLPMNMCNMWDNRDHKFKTFMLDKHQCSLLWWQNSQNYVKSANSKRYAVLQLWPWRKINHDNCQCTENLTGNCENIKYSNVKPSNFPNSHKIKSYMIPMTLKVTPKIEEKIKNDWWLYILFLNIKNSWSSHRLVNVFGRVITS